MIKEFPNKCTIRVLTTPYQGVDHTAGKRRIRCSYDFKSGKNDCPLCIKNYKSNRFWVVGVINRADQKYGIYRMPYGVFSEMRKIVRDPIFGNPINYDVSVTRLGPFGYRVDALPHKPLSAQDQSILDAIDKEAIMKLVEPCPKDRMEKLMVLL